MTSAHAKPTAMRWISSTLVTVLVTAGAAVLSYWPVYRTIPENTAVLKLSFSHGAARRASCRKLSPAEQAELPANMKRTEVCDRRRPPVYVELDIDGSTIFTADLPPSGIAGDGPSRVYKRFVLPEGEHKLAVRLRDTIRTEGFDQSAERDVVLAPGQNFVIDYVPVAGGFVFR